MDVVRRSKVLGTHENRKKNKRYERRKLNANNKESVRIDSFDGSGGDQQWGKSETEKRPVNKERFYQTMKRPRKNSSSQSYSSYRAFLKGDLNNSLETDNSSSLSLNVLLSKSYEEEESKTSIETFNEYSCDSTMEHESSEIEEQLVEPKVALITASLSDIRTLSLESLKSENQEFLETPKKRRKNKPKNETTAKKIDTPTVVLRSKQGDNLKHKQKKRTISESETVTLRKKLHRAFPSADEESIKNKRLSLQEPKSARSKKVYRTTTLYWENQEGDSADLEDLVFNISMEARIQSRFNDTILHNAATNGQLDIVKFYLDKNKYLNEQNKHLNTALHCATFYKHFDIIKILLDYNADSDLQNVDGDTALHLACDKELSDAVNLFILKGCNLNIQNENGETALHVAVHRQKLEITKMLIENGADITIGNKHGNTPMHSAIHYFATKDTISFLMAAMERLRKKQEDGGTSDQNRKDSCEEKTGDESCDDSMVIEDEVKTDDLVDSGTETDNEGQNSGEFDGYCVDELDSSTNKLTDVTDGKTSYTITHRSTKNQILSATVNPPSTYFDFATNVYSSSEETKSDCVFIERNRATDTNCETENELATRLDPKRTELKNGFFNLMNLGGDTLLHRAVKYCSPEIVRIILDNPNVKVNIINNKGNSVLHCASILPDMETAKLIVAKEKSLIDLKNGLGNTALHCATKRGGVDIVAALIKEGAILDMQNHKGETPYHYAAKHGQYECLTLLLEANADGTISDENGKLPINYVIEKADVYMLQLISKYCCQGNTKELFVNLKNQQGDFPIHSVLKSHVDEELNVQMIKILTNNFADINAVDKQGNTALHLALEGNKNRLVEILLEDSNFDVQNNDGDTILHLIAKNNYLDLMTKIKPTFAELGVKNKNGLTPLNIALQCCHGDMSLTLLNMTWNLEISL